MDADLVQLRERIATIEEELDHLSTTVRPRNSALYEALALPYYQQIQSLRAQTAAKMAEQLRKLRAAMPDSFVAALESLGDRMIDLEDLAFNKFCLWCANNALAIADALERMDAVIADDIVVSPTQRITANVDAVILTLRAMAMAIDRAARYQRDAERQPDVAEMSDYDATILILLRTKCKEIANFSIRCSNKVSESLRNDLEEFGVQADVIVGLINATLRADGLQ